MGPLRRLLLVPAALLLLAPLALRASARAPAGQSAASGLGVPRGSAVPRFALFGWVSPPLSLTAESRYKEMARAGFNVTVLAWDDSGRAKDNLQRLEASRRYGLHNLLLDNRLDSVFAARPATLALADTIVDTYANDPAFMGYYMGDEPREDAFERLGEWFAILHARDPGHPAWNSLAGRMGFPSHDAFETYTRRYVAATRPAILCNSHYEFLDGRDLHQLPENIATLAQIARENDIPFWGIVLLVEHGVFRHVTDGMLRWQAAQWLAHGARGIGYFTYWTPAPDPYYDWQPAMVAWGTGARTATFDTVSAINAHMAPIGNTLAGARWLATAYAGSVPAFGEAFRANSVLASVSGRATLGFFADSSGAPLVFLANSDSLSSQAVSLVPALRRRVSRLSEDGSRWIDCTPGSPGQLTIPLAAGDFTLLRFSGSADTVAGVEGAFPGTLRLDFSPNPAGGAVRFSLGGVRAAAKLEVLDVSGRRVWSAACAPGAREVNWSGDAAGGGRAPAGVYLARLTCEGRTATRRVSWLGDR